MPAAGQGDRQQSLTQVSELISFKRYILDLHNLYNIVRYMLYFVSFSINSRLSENIVGQECRLRKDLTSINPGQGVLLPTLSSAEKV